MVIHYASRKLEKQLSSPRTIKKYYSNDYVKITNRLSEIAVANNLAEISELPPARRHKLGGKLQNCWGIDYSKNYRFIIRPLGEFDINELSSIVEIEIVDLEDYH